MSDPSLKPPNLKPLNSTLERRNSTSTTERKVSRPQISPALYTTPEATPLPDSPSSFPPSPYIINHKRRGPRLLKSFSEDDVSSRQKAVSEKKSDGNTNDGETMGANITKLASVTLSILKPIKGHVNGVHDNPIQKDHVNNGHDGPVEKSNVNGAHDGEHVSSNVELGSSNLGLGNSNVSNGLARENDTTKLVAVNTVRDVVSEEFYDPRESMSFRSNTEEEDSAGAEMSLKFAAPIELSSESGLQNSLHDIEAELREIRLSLLMEIEKRNQAEEALNFMQSHWQRIRQQLAHLGLTLPADPTSVAEGEQLDIDPVEELCQQLHIAQFVSDSIGRGIAKAEMQTETEAQIESKNFEIARLWDRLHYYETVNREMSQRNQEAVEMARRDRQRRKRRQRWVWGTIAAAITLWHCNLSVVLSSVQKRIILH